MDPDLVTAFEEQYEVDVIEDFYESNEALLAEMQAGLADDLIVPSDYMVGIMIENGLLASARTPRPYPTWRISRPGSPSSLLPGPSTGPPINTGPPASA